LDQIATIFIHEPKVTCCKELISAARKFIFLPRESNLQRRQLS